jgi:O-acetyl-ADP-ribose deacetylase (regulator of RNase III)
MQKRLGAGVLELTVGDVTLSEVDAVVNAANSALAGGGGVDGAIHRRGGPAIMEETNRRYPDGCPTGSAVITSGGDLTARYVIHAVGPIWNGGLQGESGLLASAYRSVLQLAIAHDCMSLAFPSLSTGAYRYPIDLASRVALATVVDFFRGAAPTTLQRVQFVLFDQGAYGAYAAAREEFKTLEEDRLE